MAETVRDETKRLANRDEYREDARARRAKVMATLDALRDCAIALHPKVDAVKEAAALYDEAMEILNHSQPL